MDKNPKRLTMLINVLFCVIINEDYYNCLLDSEQVIHSQISLYLTNYRTNIKRQLGIPDSGDLKVDFVFYVIIIYKETIYV